MAAPNAGRQAKWRVNPKLSVIAACVGDIGTHAEHLIEFTTGLKIQAVCADLATFVEGRVLDDDATILLRLADGAKGVIELSEVACGEENRFSLRIYGALGCLEWNQQTPEDLIFRSNDGAMKIYRRNWAEMDDSLKRFVRLPAGHPEGFLEAFANLYSEFADAVDARRENRDSISDFPGVEDGVREVNFIEKVVLSSQADSAWLTLEEI
ncbi:MAG: Gfo/Idh/MocA family oxidoreductase [Victivallaceae bacterium]|nr:Gfo/Idh/MocA family oxidoreductase [Victivallaceae bacterium]